MIKGLLPIPYANILTVAVFDKWDFKKQFAEQKTKRSVYTGVAGYPTTFSTFKYIIYENIVKMQDRNIYNSHLLANACGFFLTVLVCLRYA